MVVSLSEYGKDLNLDQHRLGQVDAQRGPEVR
jgi:hypothetical protein